MSGKLLACGAGLAGGGGLKGWALAGWNNRNAKFREGSPSADEIPFLTWVMES